MSKEKKDELIISAIEATEEVTRESIIMNVKQNIEAEIGRGENVNQIDETKERD